MKSNGLIFWPDLSLPVTNPQKILIAFIKLREIIHCFSVIESYGQLVDIPSCLLQPFEMNLHSPTTLLSNIQFMRNRLRSDKELLNDIKHDFSHFSKKPRPAPIETILEESLRDNSGHPNTSLTKDDKGADKALRSKVLQLKKQHQRQLSKLRQQHQIQLQKLLEGHAMEKEEVQKCWRQKVEEQSRYISILEQQVSSPIQTEREKVTYEQYDAVINQLLQENTRLHHQLQNTRDQCEHWRKQARQLSTQRCQRSRYNFVYKKNTSKTTDTERDSGCISQTNARSIYVNDENRDTSNFSSQWDEDFIDNDEGGLRTIREFPLGVAQSDKALVFRKGCDQNQ